MTTAQSKDDMCNFCGRHPRLPSCNICEECRQVYRMRDTFRRMARIARDQAGRFPELEMARELRRSGFKVVPINQDPHPSAADSSAVSEKPDSRKALQDILAITGATQHRPYTALSQIDQVVRKALAPGGS